MQLARKKLYLAWWILRITYGILFIIVGMDKFVNVLTNWYQFLGEIILNLIPFSYDYFLMIFGIIQITAGLFLFTRWFYWGIYIIFALLFLIFINLLTTPYSILVMTHDVLMIIGMIVFTQLSLIVKPKEAYYSN